MTTENKIRGYITDRFGKAVTEFNKYNESHTRTR